MKHLVLSAMAFCTMPFIAEAQFQLEQIYANAGTPGSGNQFIMVELETLGKRYVYFNRPARTLTFFDLDHQQVQVIDLSAAPDNNNPGARQVLYITQFLFDLDPGIELMYGVAGGPDQANVTTYIMDESGDIIQAFPNEMGYVITNYPQAHFPIYDSPQGAKMVLSHQTTQEAKVYGLPGHLPTGMVPTGGTSELMGSAKVYPNPAAEELRIELNGPLDAETHTLRLYSTNGTLVLERPLNSRITTLHRSGLVAGAYTYTIAQGALVWTAGTVVLE